MASVRLPWDMTFQAEKSIIRKDKKEGDSLYENCRHRLKHRARPVGGKHILQYIYIDKEVERVFIKVKVYI